MFVNGVCSFKKNGLWGVMVADGSSTDAVFEDIDMEPDEWVKVKLNGEWGFIDEDNQFTLDEEAAYYAMYVD